MEKHLISKAPESKKQKINITSNVSSLLHCCFRITSMLHRESKNTNPARISVFHFVNQTALIVIYCSPMYKPESIYSIHTSVRNFVLLLWHSSVHTVCYRGPLCQNPQRALTQKPRSELNWMIYHHANMSTIAEMYSHANKALVSRKLSVTWPADSCSVLLQLQYIKCIRYQISDNLESEYVLVLWQRVFHLVFTP